MLGNVQEWCLDVWYDNFIGAPHDESARIHNPDNENSWHLSAVVKGGAWDHRDIAIKCYYRAKKLKHIRDSRTGFRIVLCEIK